MQQAQSPILGHRMYHSLCEAINGGAKKVCSTVLPARGRCNTFTSLSPYLLLPWQAVLIGSDCPDMGPDVLSAALSALDSFDVRCPCLSLQPPPAGITLSCSAIGVPLMTGTLDAVRLFSDRLLTEGTIWSACHACRMASLRCDCFFLLSYLRPL